MSTEYLTDDELDELITEYDTEAPQDRILWYALVELKTHRIIRSLGGKKPLGEPNDMTQEANKTSIKE